VTYPSVAIVQENSRGNPEESRQEMPPLVGRQKGKKSSPSETRKNVLCVIFEIRKAAFLAASMFSSGERGHEEKGKK